MPVVGEHTKVWRDIMKYRGASAESEASWCAPPLDVVSTRIRARLVTEDALLTRLNAEEVVMQ